MLGIREGGGYHDFSSKFLSHSTEFYCRGTLLCFRKFRVSKKYAQRLEDHDLLQDFFCLTVRKNFLVGLFCVSQFFCYRKVSCKRDREGEVWSITIFFQNFCLRVPKSFEEEQSSVSENLCYREILGIREAAGITIFRQSCFASQYRKIWYRNPFVFPKVLGIKTFYA